MANAGRSRRCHRCKQRKVKCDEQRPSCGTCLQRGETCPGYAPAFEFRHEYDKPQDGSSTANVHSTRAVQSASPPAGSDLAKRRRQKDLVLLHYGGGSKTFIRPSPSSAKNAAHSIRMPILDMPNDPTNRLRKTLIYLMDPRMPRNVRLDHYGAMFLDKLPAYIGNSTALDTAVETFCLWHRNFVGMEKDEVKFLRSQARALSTLREDLASKAMCKKSETLCASIILAGIQTFVSKGHRDGIYALLCFRGPPKESDPDFDFYESLVISSQGLAWNKSLEDGTECFLSSPEWQGTIRNALDSSKPLGQKYGIASKASGLLACFPGLLKEAVDLLSSGAYAGPDADSTRTMMRKLYEWRADVLRPEPALCDLQDTIYAAFGLARPPPPPRAFEPINTEVKAYLCCFVASLIVIRRLLALLDPATVAAPDPLTHKTCADELAVTTRIAAEGFAVLIDHNVAALPYLQATLGALVEPMHALDGLGTWNDIVNPMLLGDSDFDPLSFDPPLDPALEAFGGAYTAEGAFEELIAPDSCSPPLSV